MQITGQGALITGGASGLGLATARRIAAARPDLPVVVVSGFSEAEARRRVGDPPPTGFLQKPFEFDQLRAALRAAVERVSGAAGER